jgi:GNAT superfamily N-acetyltransferase
MDGFDVKPLDMSTWPDFCALVERHNGIWGGCWCVNFHPEGARRAESVEARRLMKERRVRDGSTQSALVYDGADCVGWCQFGRTEELTNIKHKRAYQEGLAALPDWRITCFFTDKRYRGKGVAAAALEGALGEIARLGGGTVESYPEDTAGRSVAGAFLFNAAISIFERQGFERTRRIGKHCWVVAKAVTPGT